MRASARRIAALLPALLLFVISAGQTLPLQVEGRSYMLGAPALVAGNVEESLWSQDGADLLYITSTQKGTQVGLYSLKTASGGIAAVLPLGEKLEKAVWLNAGHKALIVSRRKVDGREIETDLLTIRVLAVEGTTSEQLWSSEFATAMSAKIEFDLSPILAHALIKLSSSDNRTFLVLTSGAKSIVQSADLIEAMKHGEELVGWSSNGTALFPAPTRGLTRLDFAKESFNAFYSTQRRVPVLSDLPVVGRFFTTAPTTFDEGDPVLECVPSNGVLRPVRFPGFYQKPEEPRFPLGLNVVSSELRMGPSTQPVQALWLIGRGETVKRGVLISAEAKGGALSPTGRTVAFICHGALFVRAVTVD
jgi:hypothetical protein